MPNERKLKELMALAQLQAALSGPQQEQQALATREQQGRIAAAMQMLGMMQQQQEAQAQQAWQQQRLQQDATLAQADMKQKGELGQKGIDADLFRTVLGSIGDGGFSIPFATNFGGGISPTFKAQSDKTVADRAAATPDPSQYTPEALRASAGEQAAPAAPSAPMRNPLEILNNPATDEKLWRLLQGLLSPGGTQQMNPQFNPMFQTR